MYRSSPVPTKGRKSSRRTFTPFSPNIATAPLLLVVNPKVDARTLQDLLALARKQPGRMTYGSFGYGSAAHLAGEMLKLREHLDIIHVPFKGSAPALTSLEGGEIDMMFDVLVTALPQVQAGNLRALAITSDKRSVLAPDVPTMAEAGVENFEASTWFGLGHPKDDAAGFVLKLPAG